VELDLAWNKLNAVPVPQMGHFALLRRLTMRGNPLHALDELALSGGLNLSAAKWATNQTEADPSLAEPTGSAAGAELSANMSRLLETFPHLARSLAASRAQLGLGAHAAALRALLQLDQEEAADEAGAADDEEEEEAAESAVAAAEEAPASELRDELAESGFPQQGRRHQLASLGQPTAGRGPAAKLSFAAHFKHLQELDFGHCKLTYIKWTALAHLVQLKRLLLDGNQLR